MGIILESEAFKKIKITETVEFHNLKHSWLILTGFGFTFYSIWFECDGSNFSVSNLLLDQTSTEQNKYWIIALLDKTIRAILNRVHLMSDLLSVHTYLNLILCPLIHAV